MAAEKSATTAAAAASQSEKKNPSKSHTSDIPWREIYTAHLSQLRGHLKFLVMLSSKAEGKGKLVQQINTAKKLISEAKAAAKIAGVITDEPLEQSLTKRKSRLSVTFANHDEVFAGKKIKMRHIRGNKEQRKPTAEALATLRSRLGKHGRDETGASVEEDDEVKPEKAMKRSRLAYLQKGDPPGEFLSDDGDDEDDEVDEDYQDCEETRSAAENSSTSSSSSSSFSSAAASPAPASSTKTDSPAPPASADKPASTEKPASAKKPVEKPTNAKPSTTTSNVTSTKKTTDHPAPSATTQTPSTKKVKTTNTAPSPSPPPTSTRTRTRSQSSAASDPSHPVDDNENTTPKLTKKQKQNPKPSKHSADEVESATQNSAKKHKKDHYEYVGGVWSRYDGYE